MKTASSSPSQSFQQLPGEYAALCRKVWLPRPIRDVGDYEAALAAIEPLWGREEEMTADQADWFELVAGLVARYEEEMGPKGHVLPVTQRLAGLLEAQGLKAVDLARLLDLEPSMGSKILHGTRRLTAEHIRKLTRHFGLPGDYFLEG